jgi:hypothetical protein
VTARSSPFTPTRNSGGPDGAGEVRAGPGGPTGSPAERDGLPVSELGRQVAPQLPLEFEGAVSWYATIVSLDLEARGEIVRCQWGGEPVVERLLRAGESAG